MRSVSIRRQILVLLVVWLGLVWWEHRLTRNETASRQANVRIKPWVAPKLFAGRPIAALRLETPTGQSFFYAHRQGIWRCLSAYGAVASSTQIQSLIQKVLAARGVVQVRETDSTTDVRSFGLDASHRLRLAFCGPGVRTVPGGDVIFALDIGDRVPGAGGTYARAVDGSGVWALDTDFREELGWNSRSSLPPLVDRRLIPEAWPGTQAGLRRVVIERKGKAELRLERRDKERSEAEQRAGLPPWDWIIQEGDSEKTGNVRKASLYSMFLLQAPCAGLLDPKQGNEGGVDDPQVVMALESVAGDTLRLQLGGATKDGNTIVASTFSPNLFEVAPEIVALLVPEPGVLLNGDAESPWESWLVRQSAPSKE
jgi:hypothetical protein